MANRRMISSATWEDEFIGNLTFFQRCLWIGLFSTCADDQGRLIDNAVVIRSRLFPYDDIPANDIEDGLTIYEKAGKLLRYKVKGKQYIQLLKWWENQKPQWAARSKYPSPEGWTDRIRTRENDKYIAINWNPPEEEVISSPEPVTRIVQMGRQYPVPVPVIVPDPVPVPIGSTSLPENENSFGYFPIRELFRNEKTNSIQMVAIQNLVDSWGMDKAMNAFSWAAKKGLLLGPAILAVEKAIPNWDAPKMPDLNTPQKRIDHYSKLAQKENNND